MIEVTQGDITKIQVDAIVNAANTSLLGGGGVDGAIHRAGGPEILKDCKKIRSKQGGCSVGTAVITTAGKLPAKYVIHTVGPVWNQGKSNEEVLLASAYLSSLKLAVEHDLKTIAFPNISTIVLPQNNKTSPFCFPINKLSPLFPTYISQKNLYFRPFSFQKRPETYVGKQTNYPSAPPHEGVVAGTEGPEFLDHVQGDIRICGGLRDLERHWPLCVHLWICADQTRQ